jgi:hypothetical protein
MNDEDVRQFLTEEMLRPVLEDMTKEQLIDLIIKSMLDRERQLKAIE